MSLTSAPRQMDRAYISKYSDSFSSSVSATSKDAKYPLHQGDVFGESALNEDVAEAGGGVEVVVAAALVGVELARRAVRRQLPLVVQARHLDVHAGEGSAVLRRRGGRRLQLHGRSRFRRGRVAGEGSLEGCLAGRGRFRRRPAAREAAAVGALGLEEDALVHGCHARQVKRVALRSDGADARLSDRQVRDLVHLPECAAWTSNEKAPVSG